MNGYSLGALAGITIGVLVGILILLFTKKNGSMKCEYDERQQLVQGKGYKYAFFTMLIYYGLIFIADFSEINLHAESNALIMIGIGIGVCVFASYAILHDAYFALNEKVPRLIGVFAVLACINSLAAVRFIVEGKIIVDGVLTRMVSNLVVSLMLIDVLVVLLVKYFLDKKGGAED